MAQYAKLYPKLKYFFSAYFHQDWKYSYESLGDEPVFKIAVNDFKDNNPTDTIEQAINELEQFLNKDIPENDMRDIIVHQLGANINASGFGLTYRQWGKKVLDILKEIGDVP